MGKPEKLHAFARNLIRLREATGLSQKALGLKAGLSRGTVANIEGGGSPTGDTAERLAKALGVDVATMWRESDEAATAAQPPGRLLTLEEFLAVAPSFVTSGVLTVADLEVLRMLETRLKPVVKMTTRQWIQTAYDARPGVDGEG